MSLKLYKYWVQAAAHPMCFTLSKPLCISPAVNEPVYVSNFYIIIAIKLITVYICCLPAAFFRWGWSWNFFHVHSQPSADSKRAVVSYWRNNGQWVPVNRLIRLSLSRKYAFRFTDNPEMTIAVYRWLKTTKQQQQH